MNFTYKVRTWKENPVSRYSPMYHILGEITIKNKELRFNKTIRLFK
ncbi:MAG: hypothetical protein ACRDDY_17090 [Clostridium sp.]